MEETIDEAGLTAEVGAAVRCEEDILPCSLVVSDWHVTLVSCLRHCFQLGKYCDLVIQFSDGDSVKVHRVVLESCCTLACVGKTCDDDPGLVEAHPHVTAALLCPLIRFLYTGMITLTSSQLRLARAIQLTLLLDCARKLGLTDGALLDPDFEEKQNQEPSPRSPTVQPAHLVDGPALGSDGVTDASLAVHDETENVFQSNNLLPIDRGHSNEIVFPTHQVNNMVSSPTVASVESLVNFEGDLRHSELRISVDASMEVDCNNLNEKKANDEAVLPTEVMAASVHGASIKSNSMPDAVSFINPSQITVSTSNRKTSTPLLSELQFENKLESLHPSLNDHSFGSLSKLDQKVPPLSSPPVALRASLASESFSTPGDIFSHATSVHSSSPTIMEPSWASTSSANNGKVQSSCDSAFDALLQGELVKRPAAETSSHLVATSAPGDDSTAESALCNILLLPTNSQMLEKANAASRRRRRSQASEIPRPTRFLLDDADEVVGAGQPYFGAAFQDEGAPLLKDSHTQNSRLFLPQLKSSLLPNPRLETLDKLDSSVANVSNISSCCMSNSKVIDSHCRSSVSSSISSSYTATSEMSADSNITFCSPPIMPRESLSLGNGIESRTSSSSVEQKLGCKKSLTDLNIPKKKAKIERAEESLVSTAALPDATSDNTSISSEAIPKETRELLTQFSNASHSKQALFECGKLISEGSQFPRSEIKNSLNCYEIKSHDDLSFEVIPSNVALVGKSRAIHQNHMNKSELNNHARIITEVLKKFPNLIKDKKNVKLKIMKQAFDKNLSSNSIPVNDSSISSVVSTQHAEPARNIVFRCSKCQQLFATHFSLKRHVLDSHEDPTEVLRQSDIKLYACWCCSGQPRCFDSNAQLQRHLKESHHSDLLQCGECSYKSEKNIDVAFHMYKAHGTAPPCDFHFPKCKLCSFVGRSASDLDRHCTSKHSVDSYSCSSCDLSFRSLGALQGHVQAKVCQNKPGALFMCPHCSETFSKSYNLKVHLRSRHKNLKIRRVESTTSNRVSESVSIAHSSESHPEKDRSKTAVEHKQDSTCAASSYLLSYDSKMSFDASNDLPVDSSCTSSSFVVSNDVLKSSETYSVDSNSDFIEIVGSCADVGVSYAPKSFTQSTVLGELPATSRNQVHPCHVSIDDAWVCLPSDVSASPGTYFAAVSSVVKDPFSQ